MPPPALMLVTATVAYVLEVWQHLNVRQGRGAWLGYLVSVSLPENSILFRAVGA